MPFEENTYETEYKSLKVTFSSDCNFTVSVLPLGLSGKLGQEVVGQVYYRSAGLLQSCNRVVSGLTLFVAGFVCS